MCRHQTLAWRQVPPGYSALVCGCRNCSAVFDAGRLLGLSLDLAELSGCLALSLSRPHCSACLRSPGMCQNCAPPKKFNLNWHPADQLRYHWFRQEEAPGCSTC
ncbi:unnamed protein product [Polarella glacialis]|uniref:Uncharacterized protein n=1 Tax=Polarella glacialis TaxID=89957 RepID=A0A813IWM3_POLGL|nr:unnamed protein product [Polarella glacialis]